MLDPEIVMQHGEIGVLSATPVMEIGDAGCAAKVLACSQIAFFDDKSTFAPIIFPSILSTLSALILIVP